MTTAAPAPANPPAPPPTNAPLLEVRDLKVHFPVRRSLLGKPEAIRAVDGVSFAIQPGETLGLVGESGCGKTTTARAIVGLLDSAVLRGEIWLGGERIDRLDPLGMLPHRRTVQMIFQDPYASLNPRMTVGGIIGEPLAIFHLGNARARANCG
jgi:oligopeptide transport system ATP-binding protein